MPVSQMRNGLTAGNSIFSQKPTVKVSKSKFDLSRLNCFTSDIGMIVPVDVIPTLPGDVFNLSCQYKIDFRPLIVPTLTAYKVKIHYYYCPNQYLWEGWESFISKGRSGKLALTVPTIKLSDLCTKSGGSYPKLSGLTDPNFRSTSGSYYPLGVHSLSGFLSGAIPYHSSGTGVSSNHYLPYIDDTATLVDTGFKTPDVNALPYLMYQKIWRSNYCDPNLYSNGVVESKVWFPDDIDSSHWRFSYSFNNLGGTYNELFVPMTETTPSNVVANFVPVPSKVGQSGGDNAVNLLQLRYSMYMDDMFTTALPFLQRGPQTMLDLEAVLNLPEETLKLGSSSFIDVSSQSVYPSVGVALNSIHKNLSTSFYSIQKAEANTNYTRVAGPAVTYPKSYGEPNFYPILTSGGKANVSGIGFSAQQLRSLLALSVWQERNALTNGSYGQFIKVHFDNSPNNTYCEPIYIGGTTSVFNINSVLQTSASQDGSTPQGNPSGIGSSGNSGKIGTFYSNDFGFIMALMTIIPDTIYTQSSEHWTFETSPDDYFMPEYEQLSYQPILNKQLYFSNVEATDNDLFGYSNRYVYLKQRDSVARGMFALPSSVDAYYHSYVQSRQFGSAPVLSQQFVTVYPPNIDRSMLAYPGEPSFLVQFYSGVSAVRPLSYVSKPNTFGF